VTQEADNGGFLSHSTGPSVDYFLSFVSRIRTLRSLATQKGFHRQLEPLKQSRKGSEASDGNSKWLSEASDSFKTVLKGFRGHWKDKMASRSI